MYSPLPHWMTHVQVCSCVCVGEVSVKHSESRTLTNGIVFFSVFACGSCAFCDFLDFPPSGQSWSDEKAVVVRNVYTQLVVFVSIFVSFIVALLV